MKKLLFLLVIISLLSINLCSFAREHYDGYRLKRDGSRYARQPIIDFPIFGNPDKDDKDDPDDPDADGPIFGGDDDFFGESIVFIGSFFPPVVATDGVAYLIKYTNENSKSQTKIVSITPTGEEKSITLDEDIFELQISEDNSILTFVSYPIIHFDDFEDFDDFNFNDFIVSPSLNIIELPLNEATKPIVIKFDNTDFASPTIHNTSKKIYLSATEFGSGDISLSDLATFDPTEILYLINFDGSIDKRIEY